MKKIMLIEDNADNRLLVRALLEERYALSEYGDGFEGLDAIQAELPDLLILDISLPGMDGIEVLRRIRRSAAWRGLPVVAFTAHCELGDGTFRALGFDAFIGKPVTELPDFTETIDRLLATRAAA